MLDFFESIGLVCDAHFNPADFICKYIAICRKYFSLLICNKLVKLYLTFLRLSSVEKVTEGEEVQERIVKGWDAR